MDRPGGLGWLACLAWLGWHLAGWLASWSDWLAGLDWAALDWGGLGRAGPYQAWAGLGWTSLGWAKQAGLGWVELVW